MVLDEVVGDYEDQDREGIDTLKMSVGTKWTWEETYNCCSDAKEDPWW